MPNRVRQAYWWLRDLTRSRTLAFFVSERQSQLPVLDGAELRSGGIEHADAAAQMAALRGHNADEYRARLRAGHLVVYAIGSDGSLQSWGWVTAPTDEPQDAPWEFGIRMRVRPGAGFLWDYFTVPAYRGRGLYKVLLRASAEQSFIRGATRAWGYADITNIASRGGLTGADYAREHEVQMQRVGPVCRITRRGFQCTVRVGGVIEMDALLPRGD